MSDRTPRLPGFRQDALLPLVTRREALSALALLFAGCTEFDLQLPSAAERAKKKARTKAHEALRGEDGHSKLIGDYIGVRGLNTVVLEGVGLVANLNGTGDDPPASMYRTQLLEDMKRRNIKDPNTLIADPSTALVLVRAYLPPLLRKHEKFDVEVYLPDGSEATSLRGGTLMECELTEQAYVQGKGLLKGHRLAVANGAVLSVGKDNKGDSARRGSIPAGATYGGLDQNLSLHLRPDYTSFRMSQRIAARIGLRFHDYDDAGQKRPLAEAKTDSKIELILHRRYRDNYPRFLQVIGHVRLLDTPVDRRLRMERLRDDLLKGPTSERAALELEAIGSEAVPVLLEGLDSELLEVRFQSAQALAYQGHSECVPALIEAADKEPAFRVFALAALAAVGSIDASTETVQLLSHDSMETRYGAVRALTTIDDENPAVQGIETERGWILRVVSCTAEPMIHITQRQKEEIVVFGADQEFQPPMVVTAGAHFVIKGEPGKPLVTITRFVEGRPPLRKSVPARVADVLLELGRMQASYPDVVQMLVEAEKQHNLAGTIGIDVLPRPGRVYTRPSGEGGTVGTEGQTPNLFGIDFEPAEPEPADETLDTADKSRADGNLRADAASAAAGASPEAMENQVGFTVQ
ncbi:MAG: flagellar basal body P-ring protein FlgI [Planctomycetaceae bacterium]|nr:flagellar basal body P-ring protein FlgI [Planctomycetaceae bacterium]